MDIKKAIAGNIRIPSRLTIFVPYYFFRDRAHGKQVCCSQYYFLFCEAGGNCISSRPKGQLRGTLLVVCRRRSKASPNSDAIFSSFSRRAYVNILVPTSTYPQTSKTGNKSCNTHHTRANSSRPQDSALFNSSVCAFAFFREAYNAIRLLTPNSRSSASPLPG